jgi:hypothetical protein
MSVFSSRSSPEFRGICIIVGQYNALFLDHPLHPVLPQRTGFVYRANYEFLRTVNRARFAGDLHPDQGLG